MTDKKAPSPARPPSKDPESTKPDTRRSRTVVGIGASAGGLEAFSALLAQLPADTGMAFVFFQHLDPTHASLLTHLLSTKTAMPVAEVTDGLRVMPDHVYVVPPGADMTLGGGGSRSRRVMRRPHGTYRSMTFCDRWRSIWAS